MNFRAFLEYIFGLFILSFKWIIRKFSREVPFKMSIHFSWYWEMVCVCVLMPKWKQIKRYGGKWYTHTHTAYTIQTVGWLTKNQLNADLWILLFQLHIKRCFRLSLLENCDFVIWAWALAILNTYNGTHLFIKTVHKKPFYSYIIHSHRFNIISFVLRLSLSLSCSFCRSHFKCMSSNFEHIDAIVLKLLFVNWIK